MKIPTIGGLAPNRRGARHTSFVSFRSGVAAAVCFCFLLMAPASEAVDLTADLAAGYDSNPALTDPAEGSGFSVYALRAWQQFLPIDKLSLDLSVEGRYQDYWSVEDNYRVQADGSLTYVMADGRLLPSLLGEAAAYRDALVEADERNEAMIGIGATWIISSRLNLGFEQTYRWLNYRNWAKPFSGKGQGRKADTQGKGGKYSSSMGHIARLRETLPAAPDAGKGESPLNTFYPPRDNRLLATALDLDIFISAPLTARVYASYGDLNSSLDMESYREILAGVALSWFPAPQWLAGVEATWSRMEYYQIPENMVRVRSTNYIWSAELQVSRFWGNFEFFGALGWKSGDAPLDYETYSQTVIQCGLSYTF